MEDIGPDRIAELTAEMAWLRRLARAILRTDDGDDLAQDAWIVAAEHRPDDDRPLRPWLVRVVTNLTRMQARSRKRREIREAATEDVDPVTQPDELVQRVELQRLVAGEVLALAEPYRTTVLLHFFEELSSAEIARRTGVPEGTVRRRLKTALDELRARLDTRDRRSGLAALAPLAGWKSAPGAVGALAMKKVIAAVVVLLVLITAAVLWRSRSSTQKVAQGSGSSAGSTHASGSASTQTSNEATDADVPAWLAQRGAVQRRVAGRVTFRGAPVSGATVELASVASESGHGVAPRRTTNSAGEFDFGAQRAMEWSVRASAAGKSAAAVDVDLRDPRATPRSDQLELQLGACDAAMVGTIRDASGGPIAGARVAHLAERESTVPGGPAVISDERGAYELCLETRWPGWIAVEVSADGYAAITHKGIIPGRITIDFALVPEASIIGRVVRDDTGAPVANAYVFVPAGPRGLDSTPKRAAFSDATGRFHLDRLSAGRHVVHARAEGLVDRASGTPVTVAVGQTSAEIELRLEAGSTLRGRVVDGTTPVAGARVVALDGVSVVASAVSQDDGAFELAGVPRTELQFTAYPYEVTKPTSFRVTQAEHDGIELSVEARGTIRGLVVRNKKPLPNASLFISGPNDRELGDIRSDANGRFEVRGLRPGPWSLYAGDDRKGAFGRGETVHLARGATAEITIDVAYSAAIAGRVVDQNGAPVAGVTVMFNSTKSEDGGITATAEDGSFRAATMTGGSEYRPRVTRALPSNALLRPVGGGEFPVIALEGPETEVTGIVLAIQLDRLAIAGKVVDSDGAPVSDARISADLGEASPMQLPEAVQLPAGTADVDGKFSIGELLAGTYTLRARSPAGVEAALPNIRAGQSGVTIVLPTPGTIEVTTAGFTSTPQVSAVRDDGLSPTAIPNGAMFTFKNVSPGTYVLSAHAASEAATATVQVAPGQIAHATLTSSGSGSVSGIVREFRTNKPVEGMTCRALPRHGIQPAPVALGEGARTDARGAFRIAAAPAGEIAVRCDGLWRNYSDGLRLITLSRTQPADLDVPVVAWSEEAGSTLGGIDATFDDTVLVPRLVAVTPGGSAATAGLQNGDVVISVDGAPVTELSPRGVWVLIFNRAPGSKVKLGVQRGTKTVTAEVTLGNAR